MSKDLIIQDTGLNKDVESNSGNVNATVNQTLGTQTGRLAPPRIPQIDVYRQFKPSPGFTHPQPISVPTTSHLNTLPQSYANPVHQPNMI